MRTHTCKIHGAFLGTHCPDCDLAGGSPQEQRIAALEAENKRLREALENIAKHHDALAPTLPSVCATIARRALEAK